MNVVVDIVVEFVDTVEDVVDIAEVVGTVVDFVGIVEVAEDDIVVDFLRLEEAKFYWVVEVAL